MPELPEAETVRRALEQYLIGAKISRVECRRKTLRGPIPEDLGQKLTGAHMQSLSRRGKYIVIHFDNGYDMIVHLGMSGTLRIYEDKPKADSDSATSNGGYGNTGYEVKKHNHVLFYLESDEVLVYNDPRRFGQIFLSPQDQTYALDIFSKMGPEPLSDQFSPNYLAGGLARRKGPVKSVLLDQKLVAGLGNIYVCEALYRSGIDPTTPSNQLAAQEERVAALHRAIIEVLEDAIAAGGSSLKDYKSTDGSPGYFQHHFAVYGKAGRECPDCTCPARDGARVDNLENNQGIRQIVQAGRSSFYCPVRQK